MKIITVLLLAVMLAVPSLAEEGARKAVVAAIDADGIQRVQMTGGDYFFTPNRVVVKVNVPVELSVKKEPGVAPHDIVMEAPDAGMSFSVSLGTDPKTVRFTPTKTGKYPFFCTQRFLFFKSHRDRGMEGVIEVVE